MAERLSLDMECHDGGVVLRLAGRLESATVPLLDGVLRAVLGGAWGRVHIDLAGVRAIDAAGVAVLLAAEAAAVRDGHDLELSGLQASLRDRRLSGAQYARQERQTL